MKFKLNQKIYNHGDQANKAGWFTITSSESTDWGNLYSLKEINGERTMQAISEGQIQEVYKGNGSTRLVTQQAYNAYKQQMNDYISKVADRRRNREAI